MKRLFSMWLIPLFLCHIASAQSSTSTNTSTAVVPSSSTNANSTLRAITTTLVSTITPTPTSSGASSGSPYPTTYILTLTLNSTQLTNGSLTNSTASKTTEIGNGTLTVPWKEGDQWLPFHIAIDPAYGVLGALLILTGIPVAVLGGKLRWSSLAIASGYSMMIFTLVLILRFGVEPSLQPPSPNPPSTTLRGLYLLACIISSFFGAAAGIFFFNFSKYWVSAAGGFAFGWFLLAVKSGGLIQSVLGRWLLLGALTVGAFIGSLVPILHEHLVLVSTAWIGATAFVLGVDCYTRAGLKEFYIYNLGFWDLFPKLEGHKYPLTQTMIIELGIMAAMVLIGGAVQFRLLNMLQKRLKQMRDEEDARVDAEEVSKAAERFKNVGAELDEWEEKHGNGSVPKTPASDGTQPSPNSTLNDDRDGESVKLPHLAFVDADGVGPGRTSSTFSLIPKDGKSAFAGTPTSSHFGIEEMLSPKSAPTTDTDPDLESKLKLLAEVKRAREEVRGSLDKIRAGTPTPSVLRSGAPSPVIPLNANRRESILASSDGERSRRTSTTSTRILDSNDRTKFTSQSDWDAYVNDRKVITPSTLPSPGIQTSSAIMPGGSRHSQYAIISDHVAKAMDRRERTASMMELSQTALPNGILRSQSAMSVDRRDRTTSMVDFQTPQDWGPREVLSLESIAPPVRRTLSYYRTGQPLPLHDGDRFRSQNPDRSSRSLGPPLITGSASRPSALGLPGPAPLPGSRATATKGMPPPQRTMTYEELSDRHRKRMSSLQTPVTAKMREEVDLAIAKSTWEKQKRQEKGDMKKRELEKAALAQARISEAGAGDRRLSGVDKKQVLRSTDEWRQSIPAGLDGFIQPQTRISGKAEPGRPAVVKRASSQYFAN